MTHALLDLRIAESITGHSDELFGPEVTKIGDFTSGHDDAANKRQSVVLQELVFLEALLRKDLGVVADDVRLAVSVHFARGSVRVFDAI